MLVECYCLLISQIFTCIGPAYGMPEYRESLSHYIVLSKLWHHVRSSSVWIVIAIWADATKEDETRSPGVQNRIQRLDASSTWKRGSGQGRTSLWPPMWHKTPSNPNPPPISALELKDIKHTNRSMVLDFGQLWFKVCCALLIWPYLLG